MNDIALTAENEREYLENITNEARINKDWKTPNAVELETTNRFANIMWLPPVMTYEGIILLNPLENNPFIFSEWEDDRKQELFFYQTHKDIEIELFPIVMRLLSIAENPDMKEEEIIVELEKIRSWLLFAVSKMTGLYKNLDSWAFGRFRWFFEGIKFRSKDGTTYPGPSGASSAIFPTLDLILGIDTVEPLSVLAHDVRPILSGRGYTTIQEMTRAQEVVSDIGSLSVRFENSPQLLKLLKECIDTIKKFRVWHKATVQKFIPEVMAGKSGWTWWASNVPEYLWTIIANTKRAGS